ncbi:hypothetical protein BMS3Bbin10_01032 [bacterium BMS3Bbin10]|nr:hypothetical protein BMS3Bbin10_01032 [bacterium BMS3Bbin10]
MKDNNHHRDLEEELKRLEKELGDQVQGPTRQQWNDIPINPQEFGIKAAEDVAKVFREALSQSK